MLCIFWDNTACFAIIIIIFFTIASFPFLVNFIFLSASLSDRNWNRNVGSDQIQIKDFV